MQSLSKFQHIFSQIEKTNHFAQLIILMKISYDVF